MPFERPLFWHQGLFLQPQHLQLTDLHHSTQVWPYQTYGLTDFWGLADIRVQEAGLNNKSFEVLGGEFLFPDGTHAVFPGTAVIKPRSFDDAWIQGEKPFTVFLGLRKLDTSGENVTVISSLDEAANVTTRFVTTANPDEVRDLHAGGPAAQVKRLSLALRIFWENEIGQLDNYYVIPIAQIERSGEEIRLSRRFVPPCLTMAASDFLVKVIKDVRDQVTSRCRQLEEYKSPRESTSVGFDIGIVIFLLALRSLNRWVPLLLHYGETRHLHPWIVYGTLRQLIGELSTFSENVNATGERLDGTRALPPYNHSNLYECFSAALGLVGELLDSISVSPGHMIRLDFDGKYFTNEIPEHIFDSRNRFWLVLRTETQAETVAYAVRRLVKVSAKKNITTLIARAVPGAPLEYFPVPPAGLPRRANTHYFRIDHTSSQWQEIAATQAVALYWDSAPNDLGVELAVLRS